VRLNCIIVDDEPLALDILEDYIGRTPELRLAGRYTLGADALDRIREGGVDLAFLDIQMPGLGGLDLARLSGGEDKGPRVIFTTAFPGYALEGFRARAIDYLLKPVSFEEFSGAAARAAEWFGVRGGTGEQPRTLVVKSGYKQWVIPLREIVYIEGIRDYVRIHTLDQAGRRGALKTLMTLGTVEKLLPPDGFARAHRSYIVALDRVRRLERARVIIEGDLPIPVSDTYRESFSRAISLRAL
jgi:DNA-binding LytR/AlgR family response regulator